MAQKDSSWRSQIQQCNTGPCDRQQSRSDKRVKNLTDIFLANKISLIDTNYLY